jgi:hypothetical protein
VNVGEEPNAGWAPDPYRRHESRFWDGHQWTDQVLVRGKPQLDPIAFAVVPQLGEEGVSASGLEAVPLEDARLSDPLGFLPPRGHALLAVVTAGAWALVLPGVYLWRSARPLVSFGYAAALLVLVTVVGITVGGVGDAPVAGASALRPAELAPGPAGLGAPGPSAWPAGSGTLTTSGSAAGATTGPAGPSPGTTLAAVTAGSAPAQRTSTDPRAGQGETSAGPAMPPTAVSRTTGAGSSRTTVTESGPAPATSTSTDPEPTAYPSCKKMHKDHAHGVGLPGAVDEVRGSKTPVTDFLRDGVLYEANSGLDRDGDGIACEA